MLDLSDLYQFVTYADCGTLSAAADKLHISQPTLTRTMHDVEDAFGIPLTDPEVNVTYHLISSAMLFRQIEYFQAIIETGNFYQAAEKCNVSQSAISQQIKKLEQELGVKLLDRHNRTFSLTPAGE